MATTTTTTITVAAEYGAKIRAKVESGQYESTDALLAEALRLLDWHEQELKKLERLRELIAEGDEGEGIPLTRESWDADLEEIRQSFRAKDTQAAEEARVDAPR